MSFRCFKNLFLFAGLAVLSACATTPPAAEQPMAQDKTTMETPQAYSLVAPIAAGKTEAYLAAIAELTSAEGWAKSREEIGLTREVVYLQKTPQGDLAVVRLEGPGVSTMMKSVAESDNPLNRQFAELIKEYHGMDVHAHTGEPNKLLVDYHGDGDGGAHSFAFPVPSENLEAHKALGDALNSDKQDYWNSTRQNWGVLYEEVWQQETPMGTFLIVYTESNSNPPMLAAKDQSDAGKWMKGELKSVYGLDFDAATPPPQNQKILDWSAK